MYRRYLLSLFFAFLSSTSFVSAQSPPPLTAEAQNGTAAKSSHSLNDYSQEPFLIEKYYSTARFEDDGTGERSLSVRIRVQSEAGMQALGELVFGYNAGNEEVEVRSVVVHKADGTSVVTGPDAVKEMPALIVRDAPAYSDYKEKHITVSSLHPGDTLEYMIVTRIVTPLASREFWYEHNFLEGTIVLDERLELDVPKGREINLASPDFRFEKNESGTRTVFSWKRSVRSRSPENAKKKTEGNERKSPDVRATTFSNWEEVARWYAELEKGRALPSPEIRAKTLDLIQGHTAEMDQIQALYDYVAKDIRYINLPLGVGRYQPHTAAEVFANQYGDCKDKHILLAAMLAAAGFHADVVLIPSQRKLNTKFPSPSQFDHAITAVPFGNQLLWMDTTTEVAPFRLLAASLRHKSALLIAPDGAGKIVETPEDPPFLSTQRVEVEAQVSELGKLTSKLRYYVRGDNELALRIAFRRTPQAQWKELGQTVATLDGLHGEVTSVKPSDPLQIADPFELDLEFSQPNYLDWSTKKAKVVLPIAAIGVPGVPDDNTETIHLGSPLDVSVRLQLRLPANFTAQPPVGVTIPRDYAAFKSSYRYEDHLLTVERSLSFKARELPASRTSDYLAFVRAVESDETQLLSVQNFSTGAPVVPASATAEELFETALAALNSGNARAAIPLFQRVLELDPKYKQGWKDLGLAYLRAGKFEEAADAFHKQIGVDASDEHVYSYLGIALLQLQKFDEAESAYRKQIELDPLDSVAHSALGSLLLDQHKYSDAIPELDKAAALSPESPELQIALGQAYLNANDKEKALAAFDKAVVLSPTPGVWNNVAFSLADSAVALDKARQYAESAVSATSAALRNVALSNLSNDNLTAVASLGSYWDTLGWVYFRKGDDAKALDFIKAAWLLDQYGEVADHLAQIYEKRGEKQRAIHAFALSIAASHPIPESRARLVILLGGNVEIDGLVQHAQPELVAMRSFPAGKLLKEDSKADFFVLLTPEGKNAKAERVKFITGSEKLRPFGEKLRDLSYGPMFPDASTAKLVRRGTLACTASTGDCTFVLARPEDVRNTK